MSHVLLVTRPNYDEATTYLFHWCKPVIKMAINKGYKVVDIIGNKANKNDFESRVKKIKPNLIFFNGHGTETEIFGQDGETLINANEKMDILRNTIIYSRSCNSGKILGKNCIDKGITSFIGYTEPFIFAYTPSLSRRSRRYSRIID